MILYTTAVATESRHGNFQAKTRQAAQWVDFTLAGHAAQR